MTNLYREGRLESLLREHVNDLIGKNLETPVGSLVTLTLIEIYNGGQNARVGVSVIPEKFSEGVIKNLNGFANELHFKLVRILNLRTVPEFEFYTDRGAENAARLERIVIQNPEEFDKKS